MDGSGDAGEDRDATDAEPGDPERRDEPDSDAGDDAIDGTEDGTEHEARDASGAGGPAPTAEAEPRSNGGPATDPPAPEPTPGESGVGSDGPLARATALYRRHLGEYSPAAVGLGAIVLAGLALRLVLLGARVAHFDEGRVAYWAQHYAETGSFVYRYIIHGPVLQHADRWLFPILGANDFTMRLPVALVGAALPAAAWLYREHLRDSEMIAAGFLLAFNPLLLYYGRFMRSDLLVAAFMFTALGTLVRFYDTRRSRYLYATGLLVALGFGSKENAVVYLLTWAGATALLIEHALFRPRNYDSGFDLLRAKVRAVRARDDRYRIAGVYAADVAGALLLFALATVFIYAPRGSVGDVVLGVEVTGTHVGFWEGVFDPTRFGALVDTTLHGTDYLRPATDRTGSVGGIVRGMEYWFGHTGGPSCSETSIAGIDVTGLLGSVGVDVGAITGYPCTLGRFVGVLLVAAAPLTAFAVAGTVIERYGRSTSRNLVMFAAYIGFVSLLGYPFGTDIFGAWLLTHVSVPLTIPAGVGIAAVYRRGRTALLADDAAGVGIAGLVIALVVLQTALVGAGSVYGNSAGGDNALVQYAQPENALRGPVEDLERVAASHDGGPDLVVFGDELTVESDTVQRLDTQPHCMAWFNPSLPLPWYLYKDGVATACEREPTGLTDRFGADPPPVVLTAGGDAAVPTEALREAGYEATAGAQIRTGARTRTFWFHEEWRSDG